MAGAALKQVKTGQLFKREELTVCFDVFLLQYAAPFAETQCRCFDYLNIYS